MNDSVIISNIKSLALDMITSAGSGHPGIVLSSAPILYTLYKNHINVNPIDPNWFNRDRFVMSAGHGSALLYSTLFMSGFNISLDDLKQFRHISSITPGHPEVNVTPGVDCSTGPLGQGIAMAVGMALGEKILKERYRINNNESLIDYNVYSLVGDGDLMEGISYEAVSLAGTLNLDNIIVLYDSNNTSLDGDTTKSFTENVRLRFEALGWVTFLVKDGNNINDINKAITKAKESSHPVLIEVKTKIGDGSLLEGTNKAHGGVLSKEDLEQLKNKLGVPNEPFYYNEECLNNMRTYIGDRVNDKYYKSNNQYKDYNNMDIENNKELSKYVFNNDFNYNLLDKKFNIDDKKVEATRDSNVLFMDYLSKNIKTFIGGSADVGSTTKTLLTDMKDINSKDFNGNNIWYGVREHAMGAISNGLALVNLKPYCSTFLSFSDYLKPAMRMSAMMSLPVTYIYSHDSINIGQDGPTHQPVEQMAMIRSIPNMKLYRPADSKELQGCWNAILNSNHNPSTLILSRVENMGHDNTSIIESTKGGYTYFKMNNDIEYVIVATGYELSYARNIGVELLKNGYTKFSIVSMPCCELYLEQDNEYKERVIPSSAKVIVIEAGSMFGWNRISNNNIKYITIDNFGYSGTKDEVLDKMNFSYKNVRDRVFEIISSNN